MFQVCASGGVHSLVGRSWWARVEQAGAYHVSLDDCVGLLLVEYLVIAADELPHAL